MNGDEVEMLKVRNSRGRDTWRLSTMMRLSMHEYTY